ncbi:MAG: SPOR domain-containing protein [Candidatus Rokubacteria bacterium]|nr:SPOR domain-containing protein [Candidatus Rokubacteria bacterium]MBI3824489.1 SPOR domain-containing protein [Candidatus Rokubacteria bacterium]
MTAVRRQRRDRPFRPLLVGLTCLLVLGLTFALGVLAGRHWPVRPGTASTIASAGARDPAHRGAAGEARRAEPAPVLTFYQELTAPLAPSSAAARPKPAARREDPRAPGKEAQAPPKAEGVAEPASTSAVAAVAAAGPAVKDTPPAKDSAAVKDTPAPKDTPPPKDAARDREAGFTIQVGAFTARPPAEAMTASLRRAGHDAYVAEVDGGPARYRVRVGSFPTRDAARDAAATLARDGKVATYVTPR